MSTKLKRDQLPPKKAENWRKNFNEESKLTFNLKVPKIILQKETYKTLIGENENRVRVYLGLEQENNDGKYELCAYAVSAFLLGSGDVYADYETPVFKLSKKNVNLSDNNKLVIESIRLYRRWRSGELDPDHEGAPFRQYIYPNAYLLTKFELHELFNAQNRAEIQLEFGIAKTMDVIIGPVKSLESDIATENDDVFNHAGICPPYCDERSIYNS
ncbi:hypothetical protein [Maribellus sp. YY47]|uniref:hypothetical protein n=1 Tax=Maribellus sp. YY47 TaxID=2929486 RepID=UPI0020006430|nr:hypothetical protein [Maribellus sp. YY47]MCK3685639.1 hypothetical protein [Maribellus sp. YY47]